jgi:hypothetical protein
MSTPPRIPQELGSKPNFKRRLFWEYNYDTIDWLAGYEIVIQRILERGTMEEWKELVRFYSEQVIIHCLKYEINYLPDEVISDAANYFHLLQTDMRCYIRKQSRPRHWF